MSYQSIVVDFLAIFTKSSHKILKLEHLNIQKLIKNWKISCYVFVEISKKSKQYFDILYIAIHHSYLPKVSLCISGGEAGKQISAPVITNLYWSRRNMGIPFKKGPNSEYYWCGAVRERTLVLGTPVVLSSTGTGTSLCRLS